MPENAEFERQLLENRRFYEAMRDEIRTKYTGQYVGIAFGAIVAFDPDYFKVCEVVDRLISTTDHSAVFMAEDDPGFEILECYYQGALEPWVEPAGTLPPKDGTSSTSPSAV